MRWPSIKPIHVRFVFGIMRAPDAVPGRPEQPLLSLALLDGISGRTLSSTKTTSRGEFDFGRLDPGVYFIQLKPYSAFPAQEEGLISIIVGPGVSARANELDLNLAWTSCGLMYTDLHQCPQTDLHVRKLQGHVSDSGSRVLLRPADIILLDTAGTK